MVSMECSRSCSSWLRIMEGAESVSAAGQASGLMAGTGSAALEASGLPAELARGRGWCAVADRASCTAVMSCGELIAFECQGTDSI